MKQGNQRHQRGAELIQAEQLTAEETRLHAQTTVRGGPQRSSVSLLRVRNHFVQEMFKSVENL